MPRRGRMNGASLTGLLNSEARSREEILKNTRWYFGGFLIVVFLVDLAASVGVVWLSCKQQHQQHDESTKALLRCTTRAVRSGIRRLGEKSHKDATSDEEDDLGDFVVVAILRVLSMCFLLWIGVRFGKEGGYRQRGSAVSGERNNSSNSNSNSNSNNNNNSNSTSNEGESAAEDDPMTEPLLAAAAGHPDDHGEHPTTTASPRNILPDSESQQPPPPQRQNNNNNNNNNTPEEEEDPTSPSSSSTVLSRWYNNYCSSSSWTPERIRSAVLGLVFVSCTLYQVYAGLRVATMRSHHPSGDGHHDAAPHNNSSSILRIVLLCSTILWINAEAYIARVLVVELTRRDDNLLFLPPEVHRHPLYLETDKRSMAFHWCDLCQQRIGGDSGGATCTPVASNNNNGTRGNRHQPNNTPKGWCYRCALCDFDICLKCSQRNDAAIVGENVLRGDRGVRAETSLTTREYAKRSIGVAGRSEWPWLLASFVLLAVSSLTKLFLPHFQGKIIDKVVPVPYHQNNDDDDDGHHQQHSDYDKKGFFHYILVYVVVMLAQGAVSTLYSAIFTLVSRRLKFTIRNALLEKMLAQDVAYFDGTESGRLISRLTNDLDMMMSPIQSSLSSLLSNCLVLVGGMAMCFFKSYRLSMLAFVCIGPISYLWERYALWSKKLAREMLSYWAQGNSIASQALSHIRTVKAFGCEEVVLNKYSQTNKMALDCGIKDAWGNGLTSALTGYLDLGTGVLILYYGGLLVYEGEMSVGDLVTYQLFWNMMNNAYQSLQGLVTSFTRSAAGAEKVFSLWDSDPDIDPRVGSEIDASTIRGHLRLERVSFYYQMRPDNLVLDGFDLDIPAGKTLALVGRSGGGKSTIINLLLRFYDPREGRLLLDGKPYESLRVGQLRRLFGVVTQDTELFALTVEENIAYGLDKDKDYTHEEVVEAAKKAYAHDFITEMKDGYQTRIGERGGRISGGQRQRLAIARVFLRKPRIILLDEATSALDENSQEAVQKALGDLIRESGSTVVMVAHRLSTVVNADRICVIDQGRVLEEGNHEELLGIRGGIYASMVARQRSKKGDLLDQDGSADTIDDLLEDRSAG